MSSNVVAYGEAPLAHSVGDVEPAPDVEVEPDGDRGKDWPLALTFFVPVAVVYAGAAYGAYVVASSLL